LYDSIPIAMVDPTKRLGGRGATLGKGPWTVHVATRGGAPPGSTLISTAAGIPG
jgi:hypothetical protein